MLRSNLEKPDVKQEAKNPGRKRRSIEITDDFIEHARALLPFLKCISGQELGIINVDHLSECLDLMDKYEVSETHRAAGLAALQHHNLMDLGERFGSPQGYAKEYQVFAFLLAIKHKSLSTALAILLYISKMRWAPQDQKRGTSLGIVPAKDSVRMGKTWRAVHRSKILTSFISSDPLRGPNLGIEPGYSEKQESWRTDRAILRGSLA